MWTRSSPGHTVTPQLWASAKPSRFWAHDDSAPFLICASECPIFDSCLCGAVSPTRGDRRRQSDPAQLFSTSSFVSQSARCIRTWGILCFIKLMGNLGWKQKAKRRTRNKKHVFTQTFVPDLLQTAVKKNAVSYTYIYIYSADRQEHMCSGKQKP